MEGRYSANKNYLRNDRKFPKTRIVWPCEPDEKSGVSISSNIAEGFRRYHNKEYKQFLYTSLGSRAELETQITITKELKYISEEKKLFCWKKPTILAE